MTQEIVIDITPAGNIKIDAQGFTGKACEKATEQLEIVLGGGMQKKTRKPEYHLPPTDANQHNKLNF